MKKFNRKLVDIQLTTFYNIRDKGFADITYLENGKVRTVYLDLGRWYYNRINAKDRNFRVSPPKTIIKRVIKLLKTDFKTYRNHNNYMFISK